MTAHPPTAAAARCRCCGADAFSAGSALVDRIPYQDDLGPGVLLLFFCEPCVAAFEGEPAREAYVRGLLAG
jgi:hypothetical protein